MFTGFMFHIIIHFYHALVLNLKNIRLSLKLHSQEGDLLIVGQVK